jgi:hypothetical protein
VFGVWGLIDPYLPEIALGGKGAQHAQNIVFVLSRGWRTAKDPFAKIGVGTIEQRFEALELGVVETREAGIGERSEEEIALQGSAMPTSEQEPPATNVGKVVVLHRSHSTLTVLPGPISLAPP